MASVTWLHLSDLHFRTGVRPTSAVGCFSGGATPYGVLDRSGNVWEWCRTKWRADYKAKPDESPEGDDRRVLRGGAFYYFGRGVRCVSRFRDCPDYWYYFIGFRVVVAPGFRSGLVLP